MVKECGSSEKKKKGSALISISGGIKEENHSHEPCRLGQPLLLWVKIVLWVCSKYFLNLSKFVVDTDFFFATRF